MIFGFGISPESAILQRSAAGLVALDWVSWSGDTRGPPAPDDPPLEVNFSIVLTRAGAVKVQFYNSKFLYFWTSPLEQTGTTINWNGLEDGLDYSNAGKDYRVRMYLKEIGGVYGAYEDIGALTIPAGATSWSDTVYNS